jgi:hydroxymethylpyrimidine pyrophosphatase-like HAD family hydrolase
LLGGTLLIMYKDLSPGVKISISRSITTSFEQYMAKIQWDEKSFNLQDFASDWREYITKHSSWYDKLDSGVKADPSFHEDLAAKMNETIDKILSEEPTAEQIEEIESLQKDLGEEVDFSCKSEAKYLIDWMKKELKKKRNS